MKLSEITDALASTSDEIQWYYDTANQKLLMASSYDYDGEYVFDIDEMESKDEMIGLPTSYEMHEYQMMVDFATLHQPDLLDILHGTKVFRRFKDTVFELGIEQEWYKYQDQRIKEIAIAWCEEHSIVCIDV